MGILWNMKAICVGWLLRDVESTGRQDTGRRLMGIGYFMQAMGRYVTIFQNNLFVLVPVLTLRTVS